jgi:NTE family protein
MLGLGKLKVALALGGGAARGLAHLGVLRAFEREKIEIDLIAGTSIGAIIGGAYAGMRDVAVLERNIRAVLSSEEFKKNRLSFLKEARNQRGSLLFSAANLIRRGIFFGVSTLRPSFLSAEEFAGSIAAIMPDMQIEDLKIPFAAVALDLDAGEEVLVRHGALRRAAAASSAIPGVLPPVKIGKRNLIDGGWVDKLPSLAAYYMGADVVIGVDITADLKTLREYRRGTDIMVRANAIRDNVLTGFSRRLADLVIEPDVGSIHWADFSAYDKCIAMGDAAAMAMMPAIREKLRHARLFSIVRPSLHRRLADFHLSSDSLKISVV